MQLLVLGVAEHELLIGVPEHEGFRDRLDRVAQAGVGRGGTGGHAALLGDVDDDADEMLRMGPAIGHQLGTRLEPDPFARGVADAEFLVEMVGLAAADRIGQGVEVGILRVDEGVDLAEGHELAGAVIAEHGVH